MDQSGEIKTFDLGNINTFEMIFKQYYQPLVAYSRTIVLDSDEAEDIVQHTFVNFWEQRENTEVHTSVRALLYKAVHNACLNNLKHKKVRKVYRQEQEHLQAETERQDELLDAKELELRISETIDRLPEQCARIFRLSRFEQLKYQEIAEKLGLSVKTVENQMGKALRILRDELSTYMPVLLLFLIRGLL
ncbi:MAG: RNA polymerase sigma-70 factor [Bacteroidota bacterium]